jgi:hypothetical protein
VSSTNNHLLELDWLTTTEYILDIFGSGLIVYTQKRAPNVITLASIAIKKRHQLLKRENNKLLRVCYSIPNIALNYPGKYKSITK